MLELNCMTEPEMVKEVEFEIVTKYRVKVGGDSEEDIIDSISEMYNDHDIGELQKMLKKSIKEINLGDVEVIGWQGSDFLI